MRQTRRQEEQSRPEGEKQRREQGDIERVPVRQRPGVVLMGGRLTRPPPPRTQDATPSSEYRDMQMGVHRGSSQELSPLNSGGTYRGFRGLYLLVGSEGFEKATFQPQPEDTSADTAGSAEEVRTRCTEVWPCLPKGRVVGRC